MIKFYKGVEQNYLNDSTLNTNSDVIYFAEDTNKIYVNGEAYGSSGSGSSGSSTTTSDIIVAGGPLANNIAESDDAWPEGWVKDGNKVIPSGTSIQDILQGLFLKTENGTVTWGDISWNPTLASPSAKLENTNKSDAGSKVEVGTSLIVKTTTSSVVNNNTRSVVCTATHGYFELDSDGETYVYTSGNKVHSQSGNAADDSGFTITYTWNGNTISNFTSESTTVKVTSGTNTFKVAQSGVKVTTDALPSVTVYPSTNTKEMIATNPATFTDNDSESDRTKTDLQSEASDTITGYYKYFIGQCDALAADGSNITSDLVRGLNKSGEMTTSQISYTGTHGSGKGFIVACPASKSIDYIKDDAAVFEGGFSLKTMNVKDAGGDNVSYNVYYCNNTGANAAVYKFFKFK